MGYFWIARESVGFDAELRPDGAARTHVHRAFTCQPVCGPARSCLQTGLYATRTGCFRNGIPLSPNLKTLAHHFGEAGYATGYIGKWHLYSGRGTARGLSLLDIAADMIIGLASNTLEFTSDAYQTTLYDNDEQPGELPGYRVDALTDAVIRYVDNNKQETVLSVYLLH